MGLPKRTKQTAQQSELSSQIQKQIFAHETNSLNPELFVTVLKEIKIL